MISADVLRYIDSAIAVAGLFALVAGLVVEWETILPRWRRVLIAFAVNQTFLAYGFVEAAQDLPAYSPELEVPWRLYGLTCSLTAIVATLLAAAYDRHRPAGRE